jgi:hypothetical protein
MKQSQLFMRCLSWWNELYEEGEVDCLLFRDLTLNAKDLLQASNYSTLTRASDSERIIFEDSSFLVYDYDNGDLGGISIAYWAMHNWEYYQKENNE